MQAANKIFQKWAKESTKSATKAVLGAYTGAVGIGSAYGGAKGFYNWCNSDYSNIFVPIINTAVDATMFTGYTIGGAVVSGLFVAGFPITIPVGYATLS